MDADGLVCPRCSKHMQRTTRKNVEIDTCPECAGLWLDASELAQLVGSWKDLPRRGVVFPQSADSVLRCPRCQAGLERRTYSEHKRTVIDHCLDCGGIWLDRGELQRILEEVYGLAG